MTYSSHFSLSRLCVLIFSASALSVHLPAFETMETTVPCSELGAKQPASFQHGSMHNRLEQAQELMRRQNSQGSSIVSPGDVTAVVTGSSTSVSVAFISSTSTSAFPESSQPPSPPSSSAATSIPVQNVSSPPSGIVQTTAAQTSQPAFPTISSTPPLTTSVSTSRSTTSVEATHDSTSAITSLSSSSLRSSKTSIPTSSSTSRTSSSHTPSAPITTAPNSSTEPPASFRVVTSTLPNGKVVTRLITTYVSPSTTAKDSPKKAGSNAELQTGAASPGRAPSGDIAILLGGALGGMFLL